MRSYTNLRGAFRATGRPFLYPEGRTYSPPAKQAVVSLPLVGLVRSSRTVHRTLLQRGQEMPQVSIPCAVGASADAEIAACRTNPADTLPASACENLPPAALLQRWAAMFHFLQRETETKVAFYHLTKYESR